MKRLTAIAAAALLAAACSTASAPEDPPPAASPSSSSAPAASDAQLAALQTSLTELLERLDVMNDRIARLEEERVAVPVAAPAASAPASAPAARAEPSRPASTATAAPPQRALIGAKIAEDYRRAIMLYGRGSYGEARNAFQQVFDADPVGDLADNALFWVGETYFATRDYTNAMRYYARVTSEFADQNKAPDAMFKTAMAQARTSDLALARRTYQQLIERYPYSTAAASAKQELQRIKY
jgi:tol-pal system protein YbgF